MLSKLHNPLRRSDGRVLPRYLGHFTVVSLYYVWHQLPFPDARGSLGFPFRFGFEQISLWGLGFVVSPVRFAYGGLLFLTAALACVSNLLLCLYCLYYLRGRSAKAGFGCFGFSS